jgi:prepilin-type N-terminal cleavage/methylation domain-containing protein
MSRARAGFTIIELILVIVIVAIAAVAIGAAFAHVSRSLALNEDLQRAAQVAQECAEHILSLARPPRGHHAAVPVAAGSALCNGMAAAGFNRTVNVSAMAAAAPLCAAGWSCRRVQIRVVKGDAAVEINFMIVQY